MEPAPSWHPGGTDSPASLWGEREGERGRREGEGRGWVGRERGRRR